MPDTKGKRLIITAASRAYGPSLLALIGSLNLNWPNHPPVRVYDIGLDDETRDVLGEHGIEVVKVPPFCRHWRQHFTWKIWCLNDAPAQNVLWMDAGLVVLKPPDEIFDALEHQGYFLVTNYQLLDWEASEAACEGCGVPPEFRLGKLTLPGTMMGFRKEGTVREVLKEALSVALAEKNIAATEPTHRHDQAIISLLMYKHFGRVVIADGRVYLGWESPNQVPGQKIWVHRRRLLAGDQAHFTAHISMSDGPYMPALPPSSKTPTRLKGVIKRIVLFLPRRLGRKPPSKAAIYDGVRD